MDENTEQKPAITVEAANASLMQMHEVAAAMKQCNPNIHEIRAMIFDRWRTILWENIFTLQIFLNQRFVEKIEPAVEEKPKRILIRPSARPSRKIKLVR